MHVSNRNSATLLPIKRYAFILAIVWTVLVFGAVLLHTVNEQMVNVESERLQGTQTQEGDRADPSPDAMTRHVVFVAIGDTVLWMLGLCGIVFGARYIGNSLGERDAARMELQNAAEMIKTVASNIPGLIFRFCVKSIGDYRVTFSVGNSLEVFGIPEEEITDFEKFVARVDARDLERFMESIERAVREVEPWTFEGRFHKTPGETIWIRGQSSPSVIKGEIIFNGVLLDITEQKRAEETLLEQTALMSDTQRLTQVGGWKWNVAQETMTWTDELYRIHAFSPDEFDSGSPKHIERSLECYDPKDRPTVKEAFDQCAAEGRPYDLEFSFTAADGCRKWIRTTGRAVREQDRIVGVIGNVLDITERKRTEETLRISEERFKGMFENMSSGVAVYKAVDDGEDFVFLDFNPAGERIEKIGREKVIGRRVSEVFPGSVELGFLDLFRRVWRSGKPEHYPVSFYEDDRIVGWRENYVYRLPSGEIVAIYDDVTARQEAEIALRNSEDRIRSIFRAAPVGIGLVVNRVLKDANDRLCEMTGYAKEELVDQSSRMLYLSDEDYESVGREKYAQITERGTGTVETRWKRKDGGVIDVILSSTPLDIDDWSVGVTFTALDITDRKRAEQALQESEERFRSVVNQAGDGIFQSDMQGRLLDVNPRACESLGYTREELLKMNVADVDPKFTTGRHIEKAWSKLSGNASITLESIHKRKDGTTFPVEIRIDRMTIAGEENILGLVRDITEQKKIEAERERARTFLQTIIDGIPEALMVINLDYTVALANRTIREMVGSEDPVAACLKCHQVSHDLETPCECEEHPCPLGRVLETKAPVTVEHVHHDSRGREIPVEIIAAPIFDENDDVVQVIESARDISERKHAEKEHLNLERQVQHAQKLESLGVLAGGIAHDFNNILMTILGNADLALDELSPMAPARESLQEIDKAARRAAELAKQMLAYSGKGKFVVQPINLTELVGEMAHLLEISISKKAVLKYNFAENLPIFDGDLTQMRQIIMNLITNASEAIGDRSGFIALSTGAMDCDRAYLDDINEILRASLDEPLPEGLYVYMEVADTGCGMDAEVLEKVFDPFFTTKFTGRGLGMAAVLGIVRGHKGAMKIHSEVGKGTTFKILFPAKEEPRAAAIPRNKDNTKAQEWRGEGTVLIADDEETVCAVGKKMLERVGFNVLTAPDGREAVEVYREHADEIVCVLLDLTMPHLDGEEAFREIRQIRSDIKVLLCSGYSSQEISQRFAGKGIAGFIQKPYTLAVLREKLRETLSAAGEDDKA